MILLLRLNAILGRLVVDRIVDRSHLLVVTVSLEVQFALKLACLLDLGLELLAHLGDLAI